MKNFVTICCALFTFTLSFSQTTFTHNGTQYFVYPYQQSVEYATELFKYNVSTEQSIQRDSLNQTILSIDTVPSHYYGEQTLARETKKTRKLLLELRQQLPSLYINHQVSLSDDITPALKALPDGNYIQFYRDVPEVKGELLVYRNDFPSAIFTLKNNRLEGAAYWLSTHGDTIKKGNFKNGLKTGVWNYNDYYYEPSSPDVSDVTEYINGSFMDTNYVICTYIDGLENGYYERGNNKRAYAIGSYKNGEPFGEWKNYQLKTVQNGMYTVTTNELILASSYTLTDVKKSSKSVIVRNEFIPYAYEEFSEFNMPYYEEANALGVFYSLYAPEPIQGLELEEEMTTSYDGVIMEDENHYSTDMYVPMYSTAESIDLTMDNHLSFYSINKKNYTRQELIDSVGYTFGYTGKFVSYYPNGQLRFRFEIIDGKLVKEDTVFWENGSPASVVNYLSDIAQYQELQYDFNGLLIEEKRYDAKGKFIAIVQTNVPKNSYLIGGITYEKYENPYFYDYYNSDTLESVLTGPVIVSKTLWESDSTISHQHVFDPITRISNLNTYSIDGTPCYTQTMEFGEEYSFFNATESYGIGNLKCNSLINGSYRFTGQTDSFPAARLNNWQNLYDCTYDNTLLFNDQPFNGSFKLNGNAKKFNIKAKKKSIVFNYTVSEKQRLGTYKTMQKYIKNRKKNKNSAILNESIAYSGNISNTIAYSVFPFLNSVFSPVNGEQFYATDANGKSKHIRSSKKLDAFDNEVSGQFSNGKPSGTWITKDQFGKVTSIMHFENGEPNGIVQYFATTYPRKIDENTNYIPINPLLLDSLPEKPVHHLTQTSYFKNGVLNGPYREINWKGDTLTKRNYLEGRLSGPAEERSKLVYSRSNYLEGVLDGISQTYLTLPEKDPKLLYDLNFQNGLLQGESKSYHLNGKKAKNGFFLGGLPIDDFEAYDSLGTRYQYVKFQYNQPIEEKIWEENQLSLRYQFDWRDSILFNTSDITESTSLNNLMYQLGIAGNGETPYFGRPSLVDKTGINYFLTKYYPNDTMAREGAITAGKKVGCWSYWSYEGKKLYEVEYADSLMVLHDSIHFKSKGMITFLDTLGNPLSKSFIVEKVEKYDCAHTDHHEVRMYYTFWEKDSSLQRINGYTKNYYDNGSLQNEGLMKDGLATGVWKFYDPFGNLHMVGEYKHGKRNGRWLKGDLADVKYMGDICLNPNLPDIEAMLQYQENLRDISVLYYQMNVVKSRQYYGLNLNANKVDESK